MGIGKLHLLVLHFPIALIVAAALADGLWLWRRKDLFRDAAQYCILLGAAVAIPTMVTGLLLIDTPKMQAKTAHLPEVADLGETHESLGVATTIVAGLAAALRVFRRNRLAGVWAYAYGALIVGALVLVSVTGHWGGMLAFGENYLSGLF